MTNLHTAQHSARRLFTDELIAEGARPDISAHCEEHHPVIDLDNLETLLAEAGRRFENDEFESKRASDAWLGPRLHAALRVPRRLASDPGVWLYLGATVGFDYTVARFGPEPERARFVGGRDKHALARLWWTTELFRNGSDYTPAVRALENQDIVNTVIRIDAAHHRPTCQAIVRVHKRGDATAPMTGREANALSTAINCAATTLMLANLGPDTATAPDNVSSWIAERDVFNIRDCFDTLPEGPDDEPVPESSIEALRKLFTELLATAPVRDD